MQIIYTELKDTLEYTCDVNVFNVSMIMRVSYNSRSKKRLISLTSLDGSILYLKPTYITYGSRIFPNFNAIIDGLSFYITLDRLTLTGDNYLNWANQFRLCFVEYIPFEKGEGWYLAENSLEENLITPNFGEWLIKPDGITVENNNILYQAYKTNSILTYDSFATFSLETALVRSFHDTDLQQYAAFTTAVEQLIGSVDWVLDPADNRIKYYEENKIYTGDFYISFTPQKVFSSPQDACNDYWVTSGRGAEYYLSSRTPQGQYNCQGLTNNGNVIGSVTIVGGAEVTEEQEKYLPLPVVAQKVISNADSGEDEVLQMLSQDYINLVANSITNSDESKQFVKIPDLVEQFEANKTLRS